MNKSLRFASALVLLVLLGLAPVPAFAVNKDMIQLQTQVQQLQDAVARLQQSNDERMGVLKDLVQQSADSVNRMSVAVDNLQKQLAAQQAAEGTKTDQVSGQVQTLNDSLDEVKARMARLEKLLKDVQGSQQSMAASLQNMVPANTATPTSPSGPPPDGSAPAAAQPGDTSALPPSANTAPPIDSLYGTALSDYMAAKYTLATAEFGDVVKNYPDDPLAGNAIFYLGEINYRAEKFAPAVRDYDKVIEQFPDNNKVPSSHLHKGEALIRLQQRDAGVRELRALIQRFPNSPEATQARSKLNGMGVPIKPRTGF
jgi:tol-pal system protein YbgF